MQLILTDIFEAQLVRGLPEMQAEVLDGTDVGLWVFGDMLRIVMSSIMRWRNVAGAVASSAWSWDTPVGWTALNAQSSQTGCSAATVTSLSPAIGKGRKTDIFRRLGNGSVEPYSLPPEY